MFYVYILYSSSADKYYVGSSADVDARLHDHNHGDRPDQLKKYTAKHRPWELKLTIVAGEIRSEGMKMERFIKGKKSRRFIEQLIAAKGDEAQMDKLIRVPLEQD